MPTYTPNQRSQISQFCTFTQAKESIAEKFLKQQDWSLERALDSFYGTGSNMSPLGTALGDIFDKYRSPSDKNVMEIDEDQKHGTTLYLRDLHVTFEEPVILALHVMLSSESVGHFERDSFIRGWTAASSEAGKQLDTVARQAAHMQSLRTRLTVDHAYFRSIYRATFKFGLADGARSVPVETASEFWSQFFTAESGGIAWITPTAPKVPWLPLWLDYVTNKHKRPINKDLWNMVGELCIKSTEPGAENLEWWNEDGAWPMAVDDFITWIQTQHPEVGKKTATTNSTTGGDEMDTS